MSAGKPRIRRASSGSYTVAGQLPTPRSQATSIICAAAPPRSHRMLIGASGPYGSGVTSATAAAAPAMWPAKGPTVDRARSRSRSSTTMNAQRCRFFELWARRPASRIWSRSACASGRPSNDRIARLAWTASRTFIPGSSRRGRGARTSPCRRPPSPRRRRRLRRRRAVRRRPGRLLAPQHPRQRPEAAGLLVERRQPLRVRQALGLDGRGDPGGLVGRERAAEVRRRGTGRRRPGTRETRTATSAGRPRRGGSR